MTEEEKKALKYFYNLRATIHESYMLFDVGINIKCEEEMIKQISTVLNLVKKQQKEIEKKDKIIDEMAKKLFEHRNDFEWWEIGTDIDTIEEQKQYFQNKIEGSK